MENYVVEVKSAINELIKVGKIKAGQIVVVGCSTSEIVGSKIGTNSVPDVAEKVCATILEELKAEGIFLAAQCCEHLNRALIIEQVLADKLGLEIVNVVPQSKAGGSFATAAYKLFDKPVAVEQIKADAGLDIGQSFIGMHLKSVTVPLRLTVKTIGGAVISAARVRPKFIGGSRAVYNDDLN